MGIKSLSNSSGIVNFQKHQSMLAGIELNKFHHLETVRLGSSATSVEFTNLGEYSDYQHLQIRAVAKSAISDTAGNIEMTFNGVGGTSYAWHRLGAEYVGGVLAVRSTAGSSAASMRIGRTTGSLAVANTYAPNVIDILDAFETTKNTTVRGVVGVTEPGDQRIILSSGLFNGTDAISSTTLTTINGFVSGSRFSLYGLKVRA